MKPASSQLVITVITSPEAEEGIGELMRQQLGLSPVAFRRMDSRSLRISVYGLRKRRWTPAVRQSLVDGLRRIRAAGLRVYPGRIQVTALKREDWAESWKRHFPPIQISARLLIKPSWSRIRARQGQAEVVIDPGLSFGTGNHPTTRFCLEQITVAVPRETPRSFLDLGTGSGILSIAAARLGFQPVFALDNDRHAVRIAASNARANGVRRRIRFACQDLIQWNPPQSYDLICANLHKDLLESQRLKIVQALSAQGTLVLAGILRSQFREVQRQYQQAGLRLKVRKGNREWVSGAFVRSN